MSEEPRADLRAGISAEIANLNARSARLQVLLGHDPSEFDAVIDAAVRCFGDGDDHSLVWSWLCRPCLRLEERLPLEAVLEGDQERVLQLLNAMIYGVYL